MRNVLLSSRATARAASLSGTRASKSPPRMLVASHGSEKDSGLSRGHLRAAAAAAFLRRAFTRLDTAPPMAVATRELALCCVGKGYIALTAGASCFPSTDGHSASCSSAARLKQVTALAVGRRHE